VGGYCRPFTTCLCGLVSGVNFFSWGEKREMEMGPIRKRREKGRFSREKKENSKGVI